MIIVRPAQLADVPAVAPLFDAYRQFYGKPADAGLAERFISERLAKGESAVFVAEKDRQAVGFVQLYPSFSSVSAGRVYVLNDLFVAPEARRGNVARALMHAAAEYARGKGALRLSLSTGINNEKAQALYESEGWVRDEQYYHYSLTL
ncbi:GNAT family N-acetyltransferase [Massilia agilis]|uniref:GNAT family N-acetyltransferase n=2 Tax=Massilia TaxID=149698 RepID=A0ABT2BMV4_9BURK|nr:MULTISPECIES: GNAT family N-acetyltransferase [Massilia]MCS0609848.1 GNAT family N-acetyltransferase [Massilia solisilvae]MCS0809029.1 GNAT family N-acetyltransferase [Massilia agilis]